MWGLEKMFAGKAEKKPKVDALAAEREAKQVIARAAQRDGGPSVGTDSGFPDTEQMPEASGAPVRASETSRRSLVPETVPPTPVAKGGTVSNFNISPKDLEANLADPKLPEPLLPDLPQVSDPIAPNRWGADHVRPPKTSYEATPVSEATGTEELQIDTRALDAALQNPNLGGGIESSVQGYEKTRSARRLAPNPNTAPLRMPSAELNQASDELNDPKRRREDAWKSAQAIARSGQGEGIAAFRSQPPSIDEKWRQAKEADRIVAQGSKHADGLGAFRTEARDPFRTEKPVMTLERKRELRANAEKLILDLRRLIDGEKNDEERRRMEARLKMAETFYDQEFK